MNCFGRDIVKGSRSCGHLPREMADLLALVCDVELCFCHFPMWYPWSGMVLDCIDS